MRRDIVKMKKKQHIYVTQETSHVCDLFPRSGIGKYFLNLARRVRPVVCLQADTTIKIEL